MGRFDPRRSAQLRMEELKQSQGLDDQQPQGRRPKRRWESIVRTYEQPVLPKLGKLLFFSMLILTAVTLIGEASTYVRFSSHLGVGHLLSNLSTTGLGIWGIYSVLLLPVCAAGCWFNAKGFRERQKESGTQDQTDEERARSARAIRRLNLSYLRYLAVSLGGLAAWGVFFLAASH